MAAEAAHEVTRVDGGEPRGAQQWPRDLAPDGVDLGGVGGIGGGEELAFDLGAGGEADLEPGVAEAALQRGFGDPAGNQFHGAPFVPDEGIDTAAVRTGGVEFVEAVLAEHLGDLDDAEPEVDEFGHEHAIGDLGEVAEAGRDRTAVGLEEDAGQEDGVEVALTAQELGGGNTPRGGVRRAVCLLNDTALLVDLVVEDVGKRLSRDAREGVDRTLEEGGADEVIGHHEVEDVCLIGELEAEVEVPGAADVGGVAPVFEVEVTVGTDDVRGRIGRGVVDDDDAVGPSGLRGDAVEGLGEEMGSVVDGDGGEDGRHAERGEICAVRGGGGARQLSGKRADWELLNPAS